MSMNLGTLSSFSQGLQPGLDSLIAFAKQKQQEKALSATVAGMGSEAPGAIPSFDLASPPPAAPPAPGGMGATPGNGPPAPQGLAALSALLKGNQGMTAPTPPPQAAPPPAMPQPAPAGPPPVDPKLSATAQPEAMAAQPKPQGSQLSPEVQSAAQEGQQTIKAIVQDIKMRNPGIDPLTLAMATQDQIEMLKGIAPMTKATMQAQMTLLTATMKQQTATAALNARLAIAKDHNDVLLAIQQYKDDTAIETTGMKDDTQRAVGAGHDAARVAGASIGAAARRYASDNSLKGTQYSADSRSAVAKFVQAAKEDNGGKLAAGKAYSSAYNAAINGGKKPEEAMAFAEAAADAVAARVGASPSQPSGTKIPAGEISYLKAHPKDKPAFVKRYGQAAVDAATR